MKKDQINKENGSLREDKSAVDVFVLMIVLSVGADRIIRLLLFSLD